MQQRNYYATEEAKPLKSGSKVIEATLSCQYYIVCIETVFLRFKSCYCSCMFYSFWNLKCLISKLKIKFPDSTDKLIWYTEMDHFILGSDSNQCDDSVDFLKCTHIRYPNDSSDQANSMVHFINSDHTDWNQTVSSNCTFKLALS